MLRMSIFPLLLLIYNNVLYYVVHNNNCLENFRLGQGGSLYYDTTYSVLTCMNLLKEQN